MSLTSEAEQRVAGAFARLAGLAGNSPGLVYRGRFLSVLCASGTYEAPVLLRIEGGEVADATAGKALMRSWRFAFRATPEAWLAYWEPQPQPGWHDLLALVKRGAATLEGDLHPFMANLQYFKDLLALPRGRVPDAAR